MKIIVTGGAGFIGSAFIRWALGTQPEVTILNLDKLTYAGNLENLRSVEDHPDYQFLRLDICDAPAVREAFGSFAPDAVVHFAAESHVDRSILSPDAAVMTNVVGTFNLLEAARAGGAKRFVHVSTDEVYGDVEPPLLADESFPLAASSPYSASKAGSDLLALSYFRTFGVPVLVTRASNNYGPCQFPEKLIPLMICNALDGRTLPIYGDGLQIRDWLYVDDHCRAVWAVLERGRAGEVYNISAHQSVTNVTLVRQLIAILGADESLMRYVTDRPGHDRRYAITARKLMSETGWKPEKPFDEGLRETVDWYRTNQDWVARVRSGAYLDYYDANYARRTASHAP
jgi:dTDP-glucose 4,6-dehydratase